MTQTVDLKTTKSIEINGAFDAPSMIANRNRMEEMLVTKVDQIVFDFSDVEFMDSSGIGAIAYSYKRLKALGKSLSLKGLHGQPEQLIRHLGLDKNISTQFAH